MFASTMISARRWKNRKMIAVKNPFYFFSCRYKDTPTEMMTISKLFRNKFLFLNKFYSIYIFLRIYRYLFLTKRWKSVRHVNFMKLYYNTGWYLSLSGKLMMTMVFMFHVGRKGRKKHSTERGYLVRKVLSCVASKNAATTTAIKISITPTANCVVYFSLRQEIIINTSGTDDMVYCLLYFNK